MHLGGLSMSVDIKKTLRPLGAVRNYRGFQRVLYAVELVLENEDRLEAVTKEVYQRVAAHYGCSWKTVERNIRTAINTAWNRNPEYLIKMAGYPLTEPPTASEFLEIVTNYIQRNEADMDTASIFSRTGNV